MNRLPVAALALFLLLPGCGGSTSAPTAAPTTPVVTATPTPAPTPTPTPTPVPTPTPNPFAAGCGSPLPPFADSYGYGIKVQLEPTRNRKVINASPMIKNSDYCAAAGIPGYSFCNTRLETNPQRPFCDHYLSGTSQTGRPGPDWYQVVNGQRLRCGGLGVPSEAPDCNLKDNDQYLLDIRGPGHFVACGGKGSPGTCGECLISDAEFGSLHDSLGGLCMED